MISYQSFYNYYGGTSPAQLRTYAATEQDLERKALFLRLAEEQDQGVIFQSSTEGGKLHYIRRGRITNG